jgi:hypothetical protein
VEPGADWNGAEVRGLPPVESGGGWDGIPASGGVAAPRRIRLLPVTAPLLDRGRLHGRSRLARGPVAEIPVPPCGCARALTRVRWGATTSAATHGANETDARGAWDWGLGLA